MPVSNILRGDRRAIVRRRSTNAMNNFANRFLRSGRYSRIARAAVSTFFGKAASALANLVIMAVAAKHLTTEQFGLWAAVFSLVALNSFLDLGIGGAIVNLSASMKAESNATRIAQ